ncbi:hypothetical protein ERJ75_000827000 [Trypanosoma vivax]|nr:hypothetical protein TRVL_07988 [Trypanosoma vivax]KAH8613087.1 hypothetical protein ERJ75_000827000 [Trypanosoma vivax]
MVSSRPTEREEAVGLKVHVPLYSGCRRQLVACIIEPEIDYVISENGGTREKSHQRSTVCMDSHIHARTEDPERPGALYLFPSHHNVRHPMYCISPGNGAKPAPAKHSGGAVMDRNHRAQPMLPMLHGLSPSKHFEKQMNHKVRKGFQLPSIARD